MKISLRKKSKTILLCLVVMCLIFVNIKVSAQPIVRITTCPQTVEPDRILYLDIEFEYENAYQKIIKVWLHYYVNTYTYDNYKVFYPETDRPERMSLEISTFGLNLVYGDTIMLKVVCEWCNGLGGILIAEQIVDVREKSMGLGTILGIVFGSIALTTIVVITTVRRRKKKAIREEIVK